VQPTPFPVVRRHPEIADILQSLAEGNSDSTTAYGALTRIIDLYLPANASDQRAKLLGNLIGVITFSSDVRALAQLMQSARREWTTQNDLPPSNYAIPWAIATLLMATTLEIEDPTLKLDAKRAEDILYSEQLRPRLVNEN